MSSLITDILNFPKVKEMSKLKYEVFTVLYSFPDGFKSKNTYDSVGNSDVVYFPCTNTIVSTCITHKVRDIVIIHNHPYYKRSLDTFFRKTCSSEPSDLDIQSTGTFRKILWECGVNVLDHLIVCPDNSYFSFKLGGLM